MSMSTETYDRETLFRSLVQILQDMTSDWDSDFSGGIQPETWLIGELGFESIDVVQLIVAIEEHFQSRGFPFADLVMQDGRYVEDLQVEQIVSFLHRNLNQSGQ